MKVNQPANIFNQSLAQVQGGNVFGTQGGIAALAGQYPWVDLFNPAANGVTVVIRQLFLYMDSAGYINMGWETAQGGAGGAAGHSLDGLLTPSKSVVSSASVANAAGLTNMSQLYVDGVLSYLVPLPLPLILPPDVGFVMFGGVQAGTLHCSAIFEEF